MNIRVLKRQNKRTKGRAEHSLCCRAARVLHDGEEYRFSERKLEDSLDWYAKPNSERTNPKALLLLSKALIEHIEPKTYRNPVIYAREIRDEMERLGLNRREMGIRLGVSADRITQWLCLLKLPEEKLRKIEAPGDNWHKQVITERELRRLRRVTASRP